MDNQSSISTNSTISLGLVQMAMSTEPDVNLEKAVIGIREAARRECDIICLPELFRSPYFCIQETCAVDYVEKSLEDVASVLKSLAAEYGVTIVGGSIYEEKEGTRYNTSYIYGPKGQLLGEYRKTHIPHDPAFFEQNYFKSGGSNFRVFETEVRGNPVKLAVLICYDQWFPEAARSVALLGADVIFYPTAIGTVKGVVEQEGNWQDAWKTVQRGHAIANATPVAAVNRVGMEGDSVFWGGSFVADAFGKVLAEGTTREEVICAPIDLAHSRFVRDSWRFFKERRPDTYGLITEPVKK